MNETKRQDPLALSNHRTMTQSSKSLKHNQYSYYTSVDTLIYAWQKAVKLMKIF